MRNKKILLGVDGGGTKTDLFLFTSEGERLGLLRAEGSCINPALENRYEYTKNKLGEWLEQVCSFAGINRKDIDSAVLGLAGLDIKEEHENTLQVIKELIPGLVDVYNDSMMGVLAAAPNGVGVCCACGTWTSVSGKDITGKTRQVSGIGPISTESAGGEFIALEALRYAYSIRYRDAAPSALLSGVLKIMELEEDTDLHEAFHAYNLNLNKTRILKLSKLVFQCAKEEDWAAEEIINKMAHTLAENTAGCIKNLEFNDTVYIILSGSIWTKTDYSALKKIYMEDVKRRVSCSCEFKLLHEAPALGAVLQAWRNLMNDEVPEEIRFKISKAMLI